MPRELLPPFLNRIPGLGLAADMAGGAVTRVAEVASTLLGVVEDGKDTGADAVDSLKRLLPETSGQRAQREVVNLVQTLAARRAGQRKSIGESSAIYQRLTNHYLKEYLANPTPRTAQAAIDKIGAPFTGPATPGNYWEETALASWNNQQLPAGIRALRPKLPAELGGATDVLSRENVEALPYLDAPQLVGEANTDTGKDADVSGGGKNISQLMHWATGVRYCHVDKESMRELFLAYELWHLEGWDVFAEDPINDLISEEAGRLLGLKLLACEITAENLGAKLDATFNEARAWVGSLLRVRQRELTAWTASQTPIAARIWYSDKDEDQWFVWGKETLVEMREKGASLAELKTSELANRMGDIWSLMYDADKWESKHGTIKHSPFTRALLDGRFDKTMEALHHGGLGAKVGSAFINAGGFGR